MMRRVAGRRRVWARSSSARGTGWRLAFGGRGDGEEEEVVVVEDGECEGEGGSRWDGALGERRDLGCGGGGEW